ncbi:MAG TPA: hypothetical protein HA348_06355 [Thermoplasmata archaeon]|nr:hypothetical protein [Thermoplasmata archaeon]
MEKMKKKGKVIGMIIVVALLVGMTIVPMVGATNISNATQDKEGDGIGGMEISKQISGTSKTQVTWTASTDIWHPWFGPAIKSKHLSKSRDNSGSPFDIDKIGVRGRVWQDDDLRTDQTVTNYNSADAVINWQYDGTYYGGDWLARSNHVFEEGTESWYPVTEDTYT